MISLGKKTNDVFRLFTIPFLLKHDMSVQSLESSEDVLLRIVLENEDLNMFEPGESLRNPGPSIVTFFSIPVSTKSRQSSPVIPPWPCWCNMRQACAAASLFNFISLPMQSWRDTQHCTRNYGFGNREWYTHNALKNKIHWVLGHPIFRQTRVR